MSKETAEVMNVGKVDIAINFGGYKPLTIKPGKTDELPKGWCVMRKYGATELKPMCMDIDRNLVPVDLLERFAPDHAKKSAPKKEAAEPKETKAKGAAKK